MGRIAYLSFSKAPRGALFAVSGWVVLALLSLRAAQAEAHHAAPRVGFTLNAVHTPTSPRLDGKDDDEIWRDATPITITDEIAGIPVTLRAAYSDEELFILASYPDASENRTHKAYHWDPELAAYIRGPEREDTLVLKWSMLTEPEDISLSSDHSYRADIWYWKAARTDPVGYADDKIQIYCS